MYRDTSCKAYAAMVERQNVMAFATAEEAEDAGYHKTSDCPWKTANE